MMLRVALTGGIACGKSTVTQLFANLGAPIIDADVIAKQLTAPHQPLTNTLIEHFGTQIQQPDGGLDRARLRTIIFNHPEARQWLEATLHPVIRQQILAAIAALPNHTPYCIIAVPLLAELATTHRPFTHMDRVLVVTANSKQQEDRLRKRDKLDGTLARQMITSQVNTTKRLAMADDIIDNTADLAALESAVNKLDRRYKQMALSLSPPPTKPARKK